jgi:hypothetical protein
MSTFEITAILKVGGYLTKQIWLEADGSAHFDSSECVMTAGAAKRVSFDTMGELVAGINELQPQHALALGALADGVPDQCEITTSRRLNGSERPAGLIVRTRDFFTFRPGAPALALLDHDGKSMPAEVKARIDAIGGFWPAITSIIPGIERVSRVQRASTSAGLFRSDTGEQLLVSNGNCHVYIAVRDGSDIPRFLAAMHQRSWLAGFGWMTLGAAGQLLERSIIDVTVGSPERLVFEGPPRLMPPLQQDMQMRMPVALEGELLDSAVACPSLSSTEHMQLRQLMAKERVELRPDAERARRSYISMQAKRLGVSERVIERRCEGVLHPATVLEFDDKDLEGKTVADVMANPSEFVGETLADPVEGVEYGRGKAKVLPGGGNAVVIHSFAHGLGMVYHLKRDKRAIEIAVRAAPHESALQVLIDEIVQGDVDPAETEALLVIGVEVTGTKKRELNAILKKARETERKKRAREERERRLAERRDPRPQMAAPEMDDEWLPVMGTLNRVLAGTQSPEPPSRDSSKHCAEARSTEPPSLHTLVSREVNSGDE